MDKDNIFPQIKKGIEDFMTEEEGKYFQIKGGDDWIYDGYFRCDAGRWKYLCST